MSKIFLKTGFLPVSLLLSAIMVGCEARQVTVGATPPDSIYHNGNVLTGVDGAEEAVSRQEAIRLHTWAPAYQTFTEDMVGTIEEGKYADFTIVGEDILTMEADRIRYLPILRTIVGGREIYSAH